MDDIRTISSEEIVRSTIERISPSDLASAEEAQRLLDSKTKPRRSLGGLEDLACRVASIRRTPKPGRLASAVVVVAADHGFAQEGVSAYPQDVTSQMLANFADGGAAICVLARVAGARLVVVDAGTATDIAHERVLSRRIGSGTRNAALGPAMTNDQVLDALASGIELANELSVQGTGVVALGDMGIANTTSASALAAALLPADAASVCGRGTGIDDRGLDRKVRTVRKALQANRGSLDDPLKTLAALGGFEIATLSGLALGCAAQGMPVVLDGFITASAALTAWRLASRAVDSMIASHRSPEPGHSLILDALGLRPLLELDLRLGEGSGAALALPLIDASLAVLRDMATFEDAGVTDAGA